MTQCARLFIEPYPHAVGQQFLLNDPPTDDFVVSIKYRTLTGSDGGLRLVEANGPITAIHSICDGSLKRGRRAPVTVAQAGVYPQ